MVDRIVIHQEAGRLTTFPIDPGAHTIAFDTSTLRKAALSDFLVKYLESTKNESRMFKQNNAVLIGLAIGYFELSVETFFPEVTDIYSLDDVSLASIVRWTNIKSLENEQNESLERRN